MKKELLLPPEWWEEVLTDWTIDPNFLTLSDHFEDIGNLLLEFFGEGALAPSTPKSEGGDDDEDVIR